MPVLPTFTAPAVDAPISGGRRAQASDFSVDIGNAGAALRSAAFSMQAQTEEDEQRKALVANAEVRAQYAKELDDARVSGASLEPIRERMHASLDKVSEGFTTKKGAGAIKLYQANNAREFQHEADKIQVSRAASQAMIDGRRFLNSAGAMLQRNPLHLNQLESDINDFTGTLSGVPPEKRAEINAMLRKEVNEQAAHAAARLDPEQTKKLLEDGAWDLSPDQRRIALAKADSELNAKRVAANAMIAEQERQRREADMKASDSLFKEIVTTRDPQKMTRMILDSPDLLPKSREHLFRFMEARYREAKTRGGSGGSSPEVFRALWAAAVAEDGDPNKMYTTDKLIEAVANNQIKVRDAEFLRGLVAAQRDPSNNAISQRERTVVNNFEQAIKSDPRMLRFTPAERAQIVNEFAVGVQQRTKELRDTGRSPGEAFDPKSGAGFVGGVDFARQFVERAVQRKMGGAISPAPAAAPSSSTGAFRGTGATATWGDSTPAPKTQAEYNALPRGARYVDTDGVTKVKK